MSHSIKVDLLNVREKNMIATDLKNLLGDPQIRKKIVMRKVTGRSLDVTTGIYTDTWTSTTSYAMKGIYMSTEMPTGKGMGIMQFGDFYYLIPMKDVTALNLDKDDRILELRDNSGTVTVTNGSATVTGDGTTWTTSIGKGDWFKLETEENSSLIEVLSVNSDTSLTLSSTYGGVTKSNFPFEVYLEYMVVGHDADTFNGIMERYWCREIQ